MLIDIETTIPSSYHSARRDNTALAWRAATRAWWDLQRRNHTLCTSQVVLDELLRAPTGMRLAAMAMLSEVPVLQVPDRLGLVVAEYLKHKLMPAGSAADAAHVAMATLHGVDVLLSWNIKHIANPRKQRHIEAINARLGLSTPIITTPYGMLEEV